MSWVDSYKKEEPVISNLSYTERRKLANDQMKADEYRIFSHERKLRKPVNSKFRKKG